MFTGFYWLIQFLLIIFKKGTLFNLKNLYIFLLSLIIEITLYCTFFATACFAIKPT